MDHMKQTPTEPPIEGYRTPPEDGGSDKIRRIRMAGERSSAGYGLPGERR